MKVAQWHLTPCDPMDCSLPGSSVHGISPGQNTGVGTGAEPPGKESAYDAGDPRKIHWRRDRLPTPVFFGLIT